MQACYLSALWGALYGEPKFTSVKNQKCNPFLINISLIEFLSNPCYMARCLPAKMANTKQAKCKLQNAN